VAAGRAGENRREHPLSHHGAEAGKDACHRHLRFRLRPGLRGQRRADEAVLGARAPATAQIQSPRQSCAVTSPPTAPQEAAVTAAGRTAPTADTPAPTQAPPSDRTRADTHPAGPQATTHCPSPAASAWTRASLSSSAPSPTPPTSPSLRPPVRDRRPEAHVRAVRRAQGQVVGSALQYGVQPVNRQAGLSEGPI
jgi:hypothetical protein